MNRTSNGRRLVLAKPIREAFDLLSNRITEGIEASYLYLGGGTVLEAQWDHRTSTDLDLFIEMEKMKVLQQQGEMERILATAKDRNSGMRSSEDGLFWEATCGGVRFTIAGSELLPKTDRTGEQGRYFVGNDGIRTMTNLEIFTGKTKGRIVMVMFGRTELDMIPIRDLYDYAIGGMKEPDTLRKAILKMDPHYRKEAVKELRRAPDDLHLRDPQKIVSPRYDLQLKGLAGRLAGGFERADPRLFPKAERIGKDRRREKEK